MSRPWQRRRLSSGSGTPGTCAEVWHCLRGGNCELLKLSFGWKKWGAGKGSLFACPPSRPSDIDKTQLQMLGLHTQKQLQEGGFWRREISTGTPAHLNEDRQAKMNIHNL